MGEVRVVLLHALPLDGTVWRGVVAALTVEAVAPTLYDFGDALTDWASGVLDTAGRGPLVVVGNSVGGSCAIEVARLAPQRVRMLVLIGAKPGHRPDPPFRDAAVRLLRDQGMTAAWPAYLAPLFAPTAARSTLERARDIALAQPVDSIVRGVNVFHTRPDRRRFLDELDRPVVIVQGEYDPVPRDAALLAARLRRGRHVGVPGAGHYLPLAQPVELATILNAAVRREDLDSSGS